MGIGTVLVRIPNDGNRSATNMTENILKLVIFYRLSMTYHGADLNTEVCYTLFIVTEWRIYTVYPKKYAHGFVVLCFVVVMQSFIMNSHEVFIHIHQGCFAGTGAIVRLPQCQWSKPDGYGKISQCITTTKHSKAKTVCIFLGIYCTSVNYVIIVQMMTCRLFIIWTYTNIPLIGSFVLYVGELCHHCSDDDLSLVHYLNLY